MIGLPLAPVQSSRTSRNTSVNSAKIPRVGKAVAKLNLWCGGSTNIDIGGGRFDSLTDYLMSEHGVLNLIYDPFNRSAHHNQSVLAIAAQSPPQTATLSNVLNVIDNNRVITDLIEWVHAVLDENGLLFITVYEGNRSGLPTFPGSDQFQANKMTKEYIPAVSKAFSHVEIKNKLIIAKKITV